MNTVIVTGSAGLVGSETCRFYLDRGARVIGIDNDMRAVFFGNDASTAGQRRQLEQDYPRYRHVEADIRDAAAIRAVFRSCTDPVAMVVHTAAQPSHDWAASEPQTDFTVNADGTAVLLEATRRYAPAATFIFTSTNKVYGDTPNRLPLVEEDTRWEIDPAHPFAAGGIDETMSIDQTTHSLFGASKVAADVLAQEYGRYFGMNVGIFRGGCLTGPAHCGARLHGFLSYLVKCALTGREYTIYGYRGKQVRDNIHSADLVRAFDAYHRAPRPGEVYNIGGSRFSNCSVREAIAMCETMTGQRMKVKYDDTPRVGDHIWWISSIAKFRAHYPEWKLTYDVPSIMRELIGP